MRCLTVIRLPSNLIRSQKTAAGIVRTMPWRVRGVWLFKSARLFCGRARRPVPWDEGILVVEPPTARISRGAEATHHFGLNFRKGGVTQWGATLRSSPVGLVPVASGTFPAKGAKGGGVVQTEGVVSLSLPSGRAALRPVQSALLLRPRSGAVAERRRTS